MDLALLIPFFAIALTFSVPIFAIWTKHRQKLAEMEIAATSRLTAEKAAQYATHNSELEERVRVLERIVTDKGYDVASQIEALRDARRVDELLEHRAGKEAVR
jgi:IS5 family transposase